MHATRSLAAEIGGNLERTLKEPRRFWATLTPPLVGRTFLSRSALTKAHSTRARTICALLLEPFDEVLPSFMFGAFLVFCINLGLWLRYPSKTGAERRINWGWAQVDVSLCCIAAWMPHAFFSSRLLMRVFILARSPLRHKLCLERLLSTPRLAPSSSTRLRSLRPCALGVPRQLVRHVARILCRRWTLSEDSARLMRFDCLLCSTRLAFWRREYDITQRKRYPIGGDCQLCAT